MCSISAGMLGKIYYANVYSVACFAISQLLVAFKENKSVVIFVSSKHLTEENADCMPTVS